MARDITFYGSSDDLFECDGAPGDEDEIGCHSQAGVYVVETPDGQGMQVVGLYASQPGGGALEDGVWSVGVAPLAEDKPLPDWPIRLEAGGYTTRLTVSVPDDAKVRVSGFYARKARAETR